MKGSGHCTIKASTIRVTEVSFASKEARVDYAVLLIRSLQRWHAAFFCRKISALPYAAEKQEEWVVFELLCRHTHSSAVMTACKVYTWKNSPSEKLANSVSFRTLPQNADTQRVTQNNENKHTKQRRVLKYLLGIWRTITQVIQSIYSLARTGWHRANQLHFFSNFISQAVLA